MALLLKGKYMPLSEADVSPLRVASYDGQHIRLSSDGAPRFELGNYLGGGLAGVVYEARDRLHKRPVAVKILNPVGYKLAPAAALRRAEVVKPGVPVLGHTRGMTRDNVYWVRLPRRRDLLACYVLGASGVLRELTLEMCVSLWRLEHRADELTDADTTCNADVDMGPDACHRRTRPQRAASLSSEDPVQEPRSASAAAASGLCEAHAAVRATDESACGPGEPDKPMNPQDEVPRLPAKFCAFLRARRRICREIAHMHKLAGHSERGERIGGGHENVLQLYDVLELLQPTKSTLFLVLELAGGGELFDRIRGDAGVEASVARGYFAQLLHGLRFCHQLGIVHRDLKPENLLLSDADVLKIADFGLSAHFGGAELELDCERELELEPSEDNQQPVRVRRLKSLVGSPHYVAPEVLQNARYGYDGRKADMWSSGVILYGLLVGTLPFGRELATCPRYLKFAEWLRALPCDPHTGKLLFDAASYQAGSCTSSASAPNPKTALPSCHATPPMLGLMLSSSNLLWSPVAGSCSPPPSNNNAGGDAPRRAVAFPSWLFPATLSASAVFLLTSLLHPDPNKRASVEDACKSRWLLERQ